MYASSVAQANNHRATYADTVMNLGIKDANYGLVNAQKDSIDAAVIRENNLTDQQIKSYIIKDKRECAKIYSDSYITNLSVDAGMKVPDSMTDTNISAVMDSLRQASGL